MSELKTGDEAPAYRRNSDDVTSGQVLENADGLARRLNNRQIQLIAIGGSVGTALFVSIGEGLAKGGPGSLLIAYLIYSCMLGLVNNCMAEMATYMPVSGGFIRMAGKWVDDALGFVSPPIRASPAFPPSAPLRRRELYKP
jgi:amino acid transporter